MSSTDVPRVSVIIPTYRHRDFVLATLASVFEQTRNDYEIIVINDGSTDDTKAILEPLIEARRIRYFEQMNRGQSHARNAGLAQARGEFVAFLDDDDLWPANKLDWQVRFLDENPLVGAVGGTLQSIDTEGKPGWKGKYFPIIEFERLFHENPFLSPGQTLIRTRLLKELGGVNTEVWGADDWDLWFRITQVSRLVMVERLALYYRLHPQNASKQRARMLKSCCVVMETHLREVAGRKRHEYRLAAHHNLYGGFGRPLAGEVGQQLRRGNLAGAARRLRELLPLWRSFMTDRGLAIRLFRDVRG